MATTPKNPTVDELKELPRTPATDVKRLGWRGVMRTLRSAPGVVVTNHGEPEAVILTVDEYAAMARLAGQVEKRTELALDDLRLRFDRRLATLNEPDAARRLRSVMRGPAKLRGKVKAASGA